MAARGRPPKSLRLSDDELAAFLRLVIAVARANDVRIWLWSERDVVRSIAKEEGCTAHGYPPLVALARSYPPPPFPLLRIPLLFFRSLLTRLKDAV